MLILVLLACGTSESASVDPNPSGPPPEPVAAEPSGPRIGGEPILHEPVVVGGIGAEEVGGAIDARRKAIEACGSEGHSGRVLVHLAISADGVVREATVKSTSLRHPPTEQCLIDLLKATTFPRLSTGPVALVTYPFAFSG